VLIHLLPSLVCCATTNDTVGTVIALKGRWRIMRTREYIEAGQAVRAGDVLTSDTPRSDDSISVALMSGEYLGIRCNDAASTPCAAGLAIPMTKVEPNTSVRRIMAAVMSVLVDEHAKDGSPFSATIVRAGSDAQKKEMVIRYETDKPVDLSWAVVDLPKSDYVIEVSKLSNQSFDPLRPVRLDASREAPLVALNGRGLYWFRFRNEYREVALDVVVLASSADNFGAAANSFKQAQELAQEWSGPGAAASAKVFLRSYLMSLAEGYERR
jgi:hypothetical protein